MLHLRFAMLLSAIVQMKNSLIKCLEHEAKEQNPDLKMWTQVPIIEGGINPEHHPGKGFFGCEEEEDCFSLYTPKEFQNDSISAETSPHTASRENINLLLMYDDAVYLDFLIQTLRNKSVRIVEFPSMYDHTSIVPFLLVNDHSIIVIRNPKKDILPLIKMIMRKGVIYFK